MEGTDLRSFIQTLPKTETHLHLEGALPWDLVRRLDPSVPADPAFRRSGYRFPSFPAFEQTLLDHALPWFTSAERYHEAAARVFASHVAQNVRYVELSFHLPVSGFINVPGREILRAIRAAVPADLEVRVFAGMLRNSCEGALAAEIDDLADWDDLAGVDLHGDEAMPTEPWTARVWQRVRDAGKVTKCHAGEFDGASRVREAIEVLGCRRIEHGVRAIEDPAVLALAADTGTVFDVCPISNVRLGVVPSLEAHPLRRLLAAGISCTVSTDDPMVFANTLMGEYEALAAAGYARGELVALARNGLTVADVPPARRDAWLAELEVAAAQ